jgi:hypothetical protein
MRLCPTATLAICLSWGVAGPLACGGVDTIPGTEIPDTPENKDILTVLERYRAAVIKRDAAAILSTAHKTYHDEAGTEDPGDDVQYGDLGPILRARLSQLDSIRFTIDYLDIQVQGDRAIVHVWIDAAFRMKPLLDAEGTPRSAPRYARKQDHAEFELLREGETWLILRGL